MTRPPLRAVESARCDHGHRADPDDGQVVVEVSSQHLQVHAARPLAGPGMAQSGEEAGDLPGGVGRVVCAYGV